MKTFTATHSHTQNSVKEHSPINDMAAYQKRQRQLKRKKLLKNIYDGGVFTLIVVLTFSILFIGV